MRSNCWVRGEDTAQHSTAQHSTAQHSTAQHSTAYSPAQHNRNENESFTRVEMERGRERGRDGSHNAKTESRESDNINDSKTQGTESVTSRSTFFLSSQL